MTSPRPGTARNTDAEDARNATFQLFCYAEYVEVVEERSGQTLFDCVMDAVAGLYPADPSLRFEAHHRHGDVLARAAALKAGAEAVDGSA